MVPLLYPLRQKEVDKVQEWECTALLSHWEVETAVEHIRIKHRIN
jgi:hypothetical protein